jgi:hypothetical protein
MTDQVPPKGRIEAISFANRLLDEPFADPDDDLRVWARQFLREIEQPPSKDLVAKLRSYHPTSGYSRYMRQAADEIERLSRPVHEREPPHCSTCSCGLAPEPAAAPELVFGQAVTDGQIVAIYAGEEGAEFKLLRHNVHGVLSEVRRPWNLRSTFRPATYDEMRSACPHDWLNDRYCSICRPSQPPRDGQ